MMVESLLDAVVNPRQVLHEPVLTPLQSFAHLLEDRSLSARNYYSRIVNRSIWITPMKLHAVLIGCPRLDTKHKLTVMISTSFSLEVKFAMVLWMCIFTRVPLSTKT